MNMKKLIAAHAEFGRRMAGRKYEDIRGAFTSCQPSQPDAPGPHKAIINPKFSVVRARAREGIANE